MVSKLNREDFRSCSLILDPDDFALGHDEPDPPPSDLIPREVWEGILTLPGDVAIRTRIAFRGCSLGTTVRAKASPDNWVFNSSRPCGKW
jgi:hypothetical protein